jgi:hypothetical protein
MRGHNKKLPKVVKELKGTVRPCREKDNAAIEVYLDKMPPAPAELKKEGLSYYNDQGTKLLSMGLINEYNLGTFLSICFLLTKVSEVARKLNKAKDIRNEISYSRLYLEYQKSLRLSMSEFGLTPASQHKIRLPEKKKKDEFREFMNDKS